MYRFLLLSLLIIVILPFIPAGQAGAGHWPVEIYDVMDNNKVVIFLRNEDITASPQWQPADGGPPLTIAATLEHVKSWIEKDEQLKGAEVYEIELKPIQQHEQEHRWYYLVQLHGLRDGKPGDYYIAVLFNGKIVPAVVEPASIK